MPNRATHATATLAVAAIVACCAPTEPRLALTAAGALAGLLVHPDLDCSKQTFWLIYSSSHKHRGISHFPVVGTAERLLWLLGPVVAAMLLAGFVVPWEPLAWWAGGLMLADFIHSLMDWTF